MLSGQSQSGCPPTSHPEALWSFGRLSGVTVSPDGDQILFGITFYNLEEGRGYRDLYLMPAKGGDRQEVTRTPDNEHSESGDLMV
jgi:Tol biopolymer transport system component